MDLHKVQKYKAMSRTELSDSDGLWKQHKTPYFLSWIEKNMEQLNFVRHINIVYVHLFDPKKSLDMDTRGRCHHANVVQLGRKATLGFEDCWDLNLLPMCQW